MPDILHDFPIRAPVERVWAGVTSPEGLDAWWTARSAGQPDVGSEYQLRFEPNYDRRAEVTVAEPRKAFELRMTRSDPWAMYLRILRRWLEQGERVPYAERRDA